MSEIKLSGQPYSENTCLHWFATLFAVMKDSSHTTGNLLYSPQSIGKMHLQNGTNLWLVWSKDVMESPVPKPW